MPEANRGRVLISLHGGGFVSDSGSLIEGVPMANLLKQLELPLPAVLGAFSVLTDFSRPSDSRQIFALDGFSGELQPLDPKRAPDDPDPGATDREDPALSPLFADLKGMPPTPAGHLPHAFWYHFQLPETKECLDLMAKFFDQKLARQN
jgi:monoterpene epsilon-lactone hydrolase